MVSQINKMLCISLINNNSCNKKKLITLLFKNNKINNTKHRTPLRDENKIRYTTAIIKRLLKMKCKIINSSTLNIDSNNKINISKSST